MGRWNGITTGDFDGDGRMDIIASNWGRNSKYQKFLQKPLEFYYGDANQDGKTALIEAFFDADSQKIVPWRSYTSLARALPFLTQRFPTYRSFAEVSVEELLAGHSAGMKRLELNTVDSMLFLNRGDHFEPRALPPEAQFAPAFGICVADFDGDGDEDIFLSQNFFAVTTETSRFDSGRGLLLKGDGHGSFKAESGDKSGLLIYGEQRGCAAADFDHDGRVDLAITQNASETKLYRNMNAKPGLRIVLRGPMGNPFGAGAKIRLSNAESVGPVREVHAGSGYWSQDGSTQVMSLKGNPTKISVQWPNGTTSNLPVSSPTGVLEITAP